MSEFLRGKHLHVVRRATAYRNQYQRSTFSIITRYEVLRGLKAKRATKQLTRFEAMCHTDEILPLDDAVIVIAADLWAGLKRKGQLLEDNDILIAATALYHGLPVATGNVGHFSRIPGLIIEDWTKP